MAPIFSVVIPTYNRPSQLSRCVESIGRQEAGRESIEAIVVNDGGSEPDKAELVDVANGISLTIMSQQRRGPGAARNAGAFHVHGEYVVLLDDDCLLPPDWYERASASIARNPDCMIGGHTLNLLSKNRFAEASQTLVDYVYSYYNDPHEKRTPLFTSNNMIFPAALFRAIGGFDESFRAAEDRELCRRWHRHGYRSVYDASVVVHHAHDLRFASLLRQHFTYGRGALPYWQQESGGLRHLEVEPFAFYRGMLSFPFKAKRHTPASLAALIFMTQIANALGFAFEAARILRPAPSARSYFEPGPL